MKPQTEPSSSEPPPPYMRVSIRTLTGTLEITAPACSITVDPPITVPTEIRGELHYVMKRTSQVRVVWRGPRSGDLAISYLYKNAGQLAEVLARTAQAGGVIE
ncbi:MAG: hypothetical protein IPK72_08760 [Candidatus Eisenbacteria bacterium]|nr:hypothetical protein [Candidatus Eisenbacteria bacterium]